MGNKGSKTIAGIPIEKIHAIDARANDTRKITSEKPFKVNMSMDDLAKKLMQSPKSRLKK